MTRIGARDHSCEQDQIADFEVRLDEWKERQEGRDERETPGFAGDIGANGLLCTFGAPPNVGDGRIVYGVLSLALMSDVACDGTVN